MHDLLTKGPQSGSGRFENKCNLVSPELTERLNSLSPSDFNRVMHALFPVFLTVIEGFVSLQELVKNKTINETQFGEVADMAHRMTYATFSEVIKHKLGVPHAGITLPRSMTSRYPLKPIELAARIQNAAMHIEPVVTEPVVTEPVVPVGNKTVSEGNETVSEGNETVPVGNKTVSEGNETVPVKNETALVTSIAETFESVVIFEAGLPVGTVANRTFVSRCIIELSRLLTENLPPNDQIFSIAERLGFVLTISGLTLLLREISITIPQLNSGNFRAGLLGGKNTRKKRRFKTKHTKR
jgi:hypothetical protein